MANSIAERNQEKLLVNVGSSSSLQTTRSSGLSLGLHSLDGSRSPAGLRLLAGSLNQNPICLYFLFSAGSPCGCSFDDHAACLCARAREPNRRGGTLSQATPGMCPCAPFFTYRRGVSDRRGSNLRRSLLPARSAFVLLCTAEHSVKPRIIHSLGYETEEEGETEGGNGRETGSSTHCQLSVSQSSRRKHTPFSLTVRLQNLNARRGSPLVRYLRP